MQPELNFNKAATFIRSAAAQGAQLAVLPEYHLTNWKPKEPGFLELCGQWETYLEKYKELAKECGICVVPGTIVEARSGDGEEETKLVNVAYFIDGEGVVRGKYEKKNLWCVKALFGIDFLHMRAEWNSQGNGILTPLSQGPRTRPPNRQRARHPRSLRHAAG
jgi:predicted amidohydrolase